MNNCCSTDASKAYPPSTPPKQYTCPVNGKKYASVQPKTIKHHIKEPWKWNAKSQGYYFCDDPDCSVVYFAEDGSIIEQSELRTKIGIKVKPSNSTVCYCFDVNMNAARNSPEAKAFIVKNTKEHNCACDIRNPSGRCCLKDFPN